MNFPVEVEIVLRTLRNHGYDSYVVGGAVRDFYLGVKPKDYDISTSANPSIIKEVFSNYKLHELGIIHGTVGVIINHKMIEITTFREESDYAEHRYPTKIIWADKIESDLPRRDFTINAMAYYDCLIDQFDGIGDIKKKIIRTVGLPCNRFTEDALRILRALRFAAVLSFSIEEKTANAMRECKELLNDISYERILIEFKKILNGKSASKVLKEYIDIFFIIIPELAFMEELDININILRHAKCDFCIRCALLFDGLQKDILLNILKRLKVDKRSIKQIMFLNKYNDADIFQDEQLRDFLLKFDNNEVYLLLNYIFVLTVYKNQKKVNNRDINLKFIIKKYNDILKSSDCWRFKDLNINGDDLLKLGIEAKNINVELFSLLKAVNNKIINNTYDDLKDYIVNISKIR